jgi:hypothetical protein
MVCLECLHIPGGREKALSWMSIRKMILFTSTPWDLSNVSEIAFITAGVQTLRITNKDIDDETFYM